MYNEIDMNLKLLRGKPIEIEMVGKVYPITLNDIVDITIEKYYQFLSLLCVDKISIQKLLNIDDEIGVFEFIYINCIKNDEYKNFILEALEYFLREKIGLCDYGFYVGFIENNKIINEQIFEEIVKIIKLQNCLVSKVEKEKYKPVNERARKILEKLKKDQLTREKIKQRQANEDGESLDLFDLVSILSAYGNNINIFNIWDLTFFQFNNQFNRMKILKDCETNIQILMHTTEPDKVEYQHWLSKIENE